MASAAICAGDLPLTVPPALTLSDVLRPLMDGDYRAKERGFVGLEPRYGAPLPTGDASARYIRCPR